jgi:hypothetical protein
MKLRYDSWIHLAEAEETFSLISEWALTLSLLKWPSRKIQVSMTNLVVRWLVQNRMWSENQSCPDLPGTESPPSQACWGDLPIDIRLLWSLIKGMGLCLSRTHGVVLQIMQPWCVEQRVKLHPPGNFIISDFLWEHKHQAVYGNLPDLERTDIHRLTLPPKILTAIRCLVLGGLMYLQPDKLTVTADHYTLLFICDVFQ